MVIGLTGPSGAGKSAVSAFLKSKGLPIIDADLVYHDLLIPPSPCLCAIVSHFGEHVLKQSGELDRKALGAIVFSDASELEMLNKISHRFVMEKIEESLEALLKSGAATVVLDAPQLFEANADRLCDAVIAVIAPREERIDRIVKRDGIERSVAERRVDAQLTEEFFRSHADCIIENDADEATLFQRTEKILSQLGVTLP